MTNTLRLILTLLIATTILSCQKKNAGSIGLPLLPEEDLLSGLFTDSLTLITHTAKDDSLRTDDVTPVVIGSINDAELGITKSSFFTQIVHERDNPDFGKKPVLDSAVISLAYYNKQCYGDIKFQQQFEVYEITEDLYRDSVYYSNKLSKYNATPIGNVSIVPNMKDSVKVYKDRYPAHLRIKLSDKVFWEKFLTDSLCKASYKNVESFQKKFKGLFIKSSSNPSGKSGALLSIDPNSIYSKLTLFYKNESADSLSYSYPIHSYCTHYNYFAHDYTQATALTQQLTTSAAIQQSKVYVQPMASVRTKITFPKLTAMFGGQKVAINKAELVISVDQSATDSTYKPASKLLLATIDSSSKRPYVPIDYWSGADYFNGKYDPIKKEYRFNIARYIQNVVNGNIPNKGLYVTSFAYRGNGVMIFSTEANRAVLIGGDKTQPKRMRLRVVYTPVGK
jgi:hypothetical protein